MRRPGSQKEMKTTQELRVGNVVLIDGQPLVVQKAEYNKSGRNTAVVKLKFKSLLSNSSSEFVYKADEKFNVFTLDRKTCTYSYFAEPMYVFMDEEFNQYEIEAQSMGDSLHYLEEFMPAEVTFYEGCAISVDLPNTIVRKITYTEPAIRGDTSGKVLKPAKLATGYSINVPLFCAIGDKIEIDTRNNEYRSRVN